MIGNFYQAVYAHPDEGWAIINKSDDLPEKYADDFSAIERANAGLSSGTLVPMGNNENPSCMLELYFKNDTAGLVRIQYGLSDVQGRPVSFAHGYIFKDAYGLLKTPEDILSVKNENFADKRISEDQKTEIRSTPGALNKALIENSKVEDMPLELIKDRMFSSKEALEVCAMTKESYIRYILAVYVHIIAAKSDNNLYIKTDGSERYFKHLLFLTYSAVPFSMRSMLSASTYLHAEQHNTKLIFCAELPANMPYIDPVSGDSNILSDALEKRTKDRNPFIINSIESVLNGKQNLFFSGIEAALRSMGNEKLDTMQAINLAYKFGIKEYDNEERLPGLIYGWGSLPVPNTKEWEDGMSFLLKKAQEKSIVIGDEIRSVVSSRYEKAITDNFRSIAEACLMLTGERK